MSVEVSCQSVVVVVRDSEECVGVYSLDRR